MKIINALRKEPDLDIPSIVQLNGEVLKMYGIKKLIIDIDQTVAIQSTTKIPKKILEQLDFLKMELGVSNLCFLSNEINESRAAAIEKLTGIQVIRSGYKKPNPQAFAAALVKLDSSPNSTVAMVGDRLWTDILGAKRMGLFAIKVRPLSPQNDKRGVVIMRKLENIRYKYGFYKFLALSANMSSLIGLGLYQICWFIYSLLSKSDLNSYIFYVNIAFLIIVDIYFIISVGSKSRSYRGAENKNPITFFWTTYPLCFRHVLCSIILILCWVQYYYTHSITPLFIVANIYALIVHIFLLSSFSTLYHFFYSRLIRILFDIVIVYFIALNLPPKYSYLALLLLFIPLSTSSKHFGWTVSPITLIVCIGIVYKTCSVNSFDYVHFCVFCFLFIFLLLILKIDEKESTRPIDYFIKLLHNSSTRDNHILSLLKIFSKVMNCEGLYYIESENCGYYCVANQRVETGQIEIEFNQGLSNYLKDNQNNIISEPQTSPYDITQKQMKLLKDFRKNKYFLYPLPLNEVNSMMITCLPNDTNQFLIFINSLTNNGISRNKFSISHLRTANICSILLSNSETVILRV